MPEPKARVRAYRHGLGDCLLVMLPRGAGEPTFNILIDCGVILGTPDATKLMTKVVEDVAVPTNGRIDLLVVTHAHWDHVSGFLQAEAAFRKLDIGQVWLAWTEDPEDEFAQGLVRDKHRAKAALEAGVQRLRFGGRADDADDIEGLLGFFGAGAGRTTDDAVNIARGLVKTPDYVRPGEAPLAPKGTGARIFVLGPPRDETLIRKSSPSSKAPETYHAAGFSALLGQLEGGGVGDAAERPFSSLFEIPMERAQTLDFFRKHYFGGAAAPENWRRIDEAWMDASLDLALKLDSDTNNTSLALAIELADGRVMLFAADAQVGNWLSWKDLNWEVGGRVITGPDLLKRTVFYKVGHHASHNATLKAQGLELMKDLEVGFIPVNQEMAIKKRWTRMPLPSLEADLQQRAKRGLLRSDREPEPFEGLTIDPLYFEVEV
ncbi:MAG TPA: MBL fold metallo-hydrolase [Phenylobacterium sp.]